VSDAVRETNAAYVKEVPRSYILSSSSDIIASVQPQNYKAMLDTLQEFGTYPSIWIDFSTDLYFCPVLLMI
jgi:hypothetical protein